MFDKLKIAYSSAIVDQIYSIYYLYLVHLEWPKMSKKGENIAYYVCGDVPRPPFVFFNDLP